MLSYLLLFVAAVFLIRVPFLIIGFLFKFAKPLSLIAFGCLIGVSATTGVPNFSEFTGPSESPVRYEQEPSKRELQESLTSPEILEAANKIADRIEEAVFTLMGEIAMAWKESSSLQFKRDLRSRYR